ncbi:MAG: hypothetical protein F6K05_13360 [Okeania sp. SIO1H2]|nr:hypothetical protein [Okeania sp. SIO1H2]
MSEGKSQPTPRPSSSQEGKLRVIINGNYRGGSRIFFPLIFLYLSTQNANFILLTTSSARKKYIPNQGYKCGLSVGKFR